MPYLGNNHIAGDHVNNFKVLDDISSYTATFDGSATSIVSAADDTIRIPEHRFIQGQRVTYTNGGGGNIGGLTTGTAYFVSFDTPNTIKLATSLVNANSNTVINISAVGSGTSHTLNAAFDGVNTKFKLTYRDGKAARFNNATQLNVAINNVIQRPNQSALSFTEGFAIEDNHKIVFKVAPTVNDIFWGSIIANTIENFDLQDNEVDNFTGNGSITEFTLSTIPANNESVIVTIDGVLQHPSDKDTTRAYTLIDSILQFTAAPASNAEIQARHIGFAGATTADVSGFYGRTGNVTLTTGDNISVGDISTSRNINATGIVTAASFRGDGSQLTGIDATALKDTGGNVKIQAQASGAVHTGIATFNNHIDVDGHTELDNLNVSGVSTFAGDASFAGNVSIGGTLTYEDVTNVDAVGLATFRDGIVVQTGTATTALIVEGNARVTGILTIGTGSLTITERDINAVGVVTGSNFKTGTSNVHNVGIEVAQINVLGGPTKIGSGVTITNDGNYQSLGISTALQFKTGTTNVHNVGIEVAQLNVLGGDTKIGSGATIYADGSFQAVGVATAKNFKTGTTNVHNVGVELAGINVLGADTPIGTGATIFNTGQIVAQAGAEISGIVTASAFRGDGSALTGLTAVGTGAIGGLTVRNESGNNVGTAGSISTIDFNGSSGVTVIAATGAAGIATIVISAELVSDTSPQLGGNLDLNSNTINGSGTINLTGSVTATSFVGPLTGNVTGNASGSASRLAIARTIGGTSFDGTANIVPAQATNSDTVDNLHATSFVRSDASDTLSGQYTLNSSADEKIILEGSSNPYIRFREGTTNKAYIQWNASGFLELVNQESAEAIRIKSGSDGLVFLEGGSEHLVWHSGNDGSNSMLDADKLDGLQATSFLRSDADDSASGSYSFTNSYNEFGNSTGSVSNNGSWNARVNIAGTQHARLDVQSVSDGIISTMSAHTGHTAGQFGTRSNHDIAFIANGNERARLTTSGSLSSTVQGTLWGASNDGSGSGLDADLLDGQQRTGFVEHNQNSGYILRFGNGSNSGHTSSSHAYGIFQEGGAWSSPFPDLRINYHTGIVMAVGYSGYGGLRFQRDYNDSTELMSIGNGNNHVEIANNLYISGNTYIGSNNYSFRNGNNANNLAFYSGTSGAAGISMYNSSSQHILQLYGETNGYYGFLDGNWAGWDIRKLKNGALEIDPDGGGLHAVLHAGETSTSASNSTIVRRDGSGYIFANYFNSTNNDMGSGVPDRVYVSNDNYHRRVDLGSFRSLMNVGGMGRYNGREQSTSDSNYWTGAMGWSSTNFDSLFHYGSGTIDVWSNPSNQPSGTSHWVGSQHLHYSNNSNSRYGHQIVVGAGNPDLMYVRGVWGTGSWTSWRKIINDNNLSSYVSSSNILYIDVYSTGSTNDRNTANGWAQSAVSIPNDTLYIVRYYYTHSYWVGNHTGTSHEDRRTVFYKNSSGTTYWAGVDRS